MERLLERGEELDMLEEVVDALTTGQGCLVMIAGEAGIGKTSLVRTLRERVAGGVEFVLSACEPLSVPVPLGPLRELVELAGAGDLEGGDQLVLARRVFDALKRVAPVVAAIEDVHWADPTTLDVLKLLARRVEQSPVAILVTYRDDEVAANPELRRLLGDLATSPSVARIALSTLSDEAVAELARPAGVDPVQLVRVTGGNPFLVVESISAEQRPPATVRDAVLARAGRLSAETREVVEAAAVLGQRFEPEALDAISGGSEPAVEEALACGVMVSEGSVLGFRHELIREAIENSISPFRRADLHARVVSALAEAGDHARLAHHAELAGLLDDSCRHAILAAADAERVGAIREAHLQLSRALRLGSGLSRDERFELLVRATLAANFSSMRLEDAVETAEEAIRLADDPIKEGRAQGALAWALWSLDRLSEAEQAAARAVAVLEPTDEIAELARAHATHIRMEATSFDPAAALSEAARALELAERAELSETKIDLEISIGLARGHLGEAEALEQLEHACRAAREAGLAIQTVRSFVNQVYIGAQLREHAFVEGKVREALELFDAYQTRIPGWAIEVFRARSLLDQGRWDEALAIASRTHRDWSSELAGAGVIRGLVAARRGEPDAARSLEEAWDSLAGLPESSRHGMARLALVEAAWLRGDRGEALRITSEAIALPMTHRFARPAAELSLWAKRLGLDPAPPARAVEPVRLELEGDWRRAVQAWRELQAPYEAALAALPGDERAAREALTALKALGATAAIKAFARERAARGVKTPRGARRSTLAHPAGLTRREQEVLQHLATGATNAAIAEALTVSERTVAHHVSAVLTKLGAANRLAAVQRARELGVLAEPRQFEHQT
jgi:DNA-binding CsgD family transcriptional regulator/tetratricopeptide (TPR) repeat protein